MDTKTCPLSAARGHEADIPKRPETFQTHSQNPNDAEGPHEIQLNGLGDTQGAVHGMPHRVEQHRCNKSMRRARKGQCVCFPAASRPCWAGHCFLRQGKRWADADPSRHRLAIARPRKVATSGGPVACMRASPSQRRGPQSNAACVLFDRRWVDGFHYDPLFLRDDVLILDA